MDFIRHYKRQARLRAATNGTSHQAELNAIARENGHAAWGDFQAALRASTTPIPFRMPESLRPDAEELEIEALADAFESARTKGGHLVVLRPTHELERATIARLAGSMGSAYIARFEHARHVEALTEANIAEAAALGLTLIAGSGSMSRSTHTGNFVVETHDQHLWEGGALYSRRDEQIIYATTAVNYVLLQNDEETVKLTQELVSKSTIRRRMPVKNTGSNVSPSADDRCMDLEMVTVTATDGRRIGVQVIPFRCTPILAILDLDNHPRTFSRGNLPPTTNAWLHAVADLNAEEWKYHWDTPCYRELCIDGGLDPDRQRPRFAPENAEAGERLIHALCRHREWPSHQAVNLVFDLVEAIRIDQWRSPAHITALINAAKVPYEERTDHVREAFDMIHSAAGLSSEDVVRMIG